MRRAGLYLAFGFFAYLLIVVFTVPAVQVKGFVEEQLPGLSLSAVSGSAFYGRAGRASYRDSDLGSVDWRFRPLSLLTGRVEYHLEFLSPTGPAQANAGTTFIGNIFARDIDLGILPESVINKYAPVVVRTSGEIDFTVETLKINDGFPDNVIGKAVWGGAAILAPVEMVFGDTVMDIQSINGELVGRIESTGESKISGEIAFTPGGEYRVDLLLTPGAGVSRQTISVLESTTTIQAGGKYLLRNSGKW